MEVEEESPRGTLIGSLMAYDPDVGENALIDYIITGKFHVVDRVSFGVGGDEKRLSFPRGTFRGTVFHFEYSPFFSRVSSYRIKIIQYQVKDIIFFYFLSLSN